MRNFVGYVFITVLINISFNLVQCDPQNPEYIWSSPQLCEGNSTSTNDCSQQFFKALPKSCLVHRSAACATFDFSNWILTSNNLPETEETASFNVAVEPYSWYYDTRKHSAYNISLIFKDTSSSVNGFILKLTQIDHAYSSCRIFDFRKASLLKYKIDFLYYDCYVSLEGNKTYNYEYFLTVHSLPFNEELKYQINVPRPDEIDATDVCKWRTLIMILYNSLEHNKVELKFHQAPAQFSVVNYQVSLVKENITIEKHLVNQDQKNKMLKVIFKHVDKGTYVIIVSIKNASQPLSCAVTKSFPFIINRKLTGQRTIIAICGAIIIVLVIAAGAVFIFKRSLKQSVPTKMPKVLILYSYDCIEHVKVVCRFNTFLKEVCFIKTFVDFMDLKCEDDPVVWTRTKFAGVDFILLIISEGIYHKFVKKNKPEMIELFSWGNNCINTGMMLLGISPPGTHKLIKIYFNYSGKHHIPNELLAEGKVIHLLNDLRKLLTYVHQKSFKYNWFKIGCQLSVNELLSTAQGRALCDAISAMKVYAESNKSSVNFHEAVPSAQCMNVRNTFSMLPASSKINIPEKTDHEAELTLNAVSKDLPWFLRKDIDLGEEEIAFLMDNIS